LKKGFHQVFAHYLETFRLTTGFVQIGHIYSAKRQVSCILIALF